MKNSLITASIFLFFLPTAGQAATPAAQTIYALLGTSTPVESSAPIEKEITALSKQAGEITAPILADIDNARTWSANMLQGQIIQTASKLPGNELLAPSNTQAFTATNQFDWNKLLSTIIGILWTVYFYTLIIIRYLIAKALICYPILLVIFIYILYRIVRRFRRPKWRRR